MPGKSRTFTTHVDPVSPPKWYQAVSKCRRWKELVEAPGTAPGSATLIPCAVYRHSRFANRTNDKNIGLKSPPAKG